MAKFYNFNIEKIKKEYIKLAIPIMEQAWDDLFLEIQENSPVDTWLYLSTHLNRGVRIEGKKIIAEVENIWKYPEKVESGWRSSPVNWHLRNGRVYNSVGAEVYEKSVKKIWQNLIDKLK